MNNRPQCPVPTDYALDGSIVIVDDTPENLRLLVEILREHGYKTRPASSGARALATIRKELPELVLLDIMMPEMDGYEVCRQLKSDARTKDIPVIFLSALNGVIDKVKAFNSGGVDYISKPFQVEEVLARVRTHLVLRSQQKALAAQNQELIEKNARISEQARQLELLATQDFLTGIANRREFFKIAEQEERRFWRIKRPFGIIMLDIDHFKNINDTHGHECGDKVLIWVTEKIGRVLRSQDLLARWGGEEFICLLPETNLDGIKHAAEKIRRTIESSHYIVQDTSIPITITLGASLYDGSGSIESCINLADGALYQGKRQGRNRSIISAAE